MRYLAPAIDPTMVRKTAAAANIFQQPVKPNSYAPHPL